MKRYFPMEKKVNHEADDKSSPGSLNKVKDKRKKIKKRKRLIIRNLSFKVSPEELQQTFSTFGNVVNVNIPLKADGRKRGFAFVEYEDFKSLIKAMKALNNKEIHGRRVAIDYAVDKTNYQLKLQNIKKEKEDSPEKQVDKNLSGMSDDESEDEKPDIDSIKEESEDIDENERKARDFLKEFDSGFQIEKMDSEDSSDESSDDDEENEFKEENNDTDDNDEGDSDLNDDNKSLDLNKPSLKGSSKRISHDVSEGKTVFIRNVSFATSKEGLRENMEKFGDCEYCLICVDPCTDHSKGTAFVKFKNKDSADKLIEDSMTEPGILVDGRKLMCSLAVSKEVISQQSDHSKKPVDKRNLRLLKVGLVMLNSPESESVSASDMAKRKQLEMLKNQKLKNVNFFVSDKRLMIHNLPKTITDAKLKKLFIDAIGKRGIITEARVMRDFKKTSPEGVPVSRGFGFVSLSRHEDAIKALEALNNNPKTFTPQKRPIVEFSVENKVALLTKERRKEKLMQRNKKRIEETREKKLNLKAESKSREAKKSPKKGKRKLKNQDSKTNDNTVARSSISTENSPKKKQKKRNRRKSERKGGTEKSDNFNSKSFHSMVDNFKQKLLNKM